MTLAGLFAMLDVLLAVRISAEQDGGMFGFEQRWRVVGTLSDGAKVEVGAVALGGESQKGRWLLQLTGKGCGLVADWQALQELLQGLGAAISRVDLAVDFMDGEYTVDDAVDLYHQGSFTNRGRTPDFSVDGDWSEGGTKGRTVYIGKLKNGKTLCVYEKGRQLGDYTSDWTRYEVRLGNRDRVIPLDVLTDPDQFFVGAYPALAGMLDAAAEEIPTSQTEVRTSIAHLLHHMSRCYGKAIHQASVMSGVSADDLVEEMRVIGIPRRVDPAGGRAGLEWPELQAQVQRMKT